MFEWIGKNLGTIVVLALIAAGVVSIIISMIKNRRSGKGGSCGCGCSSCAMSESCRGHGAGSGGARQ